MPVSSTLWIALLCHAVAVPAAEDALPVNPTPRPALTHTLREWTFDDGSEGWVAQNNCHVSAADGLLKVRTTGFDPYFRCPVDVAGGQLVLKLRARCRTTGAATVYWITDRSPREGEDKVAVFHPKHNGQWEELEVRFEAPGRLTNLRIDPGQSAGTFDIDSIRLIHEEPHPVTIDRAVRRGDQARFFLTDHRSTPIEVSASGTDHTIAGGATIHVDRPIDTSQPLAAVSLELAAKPFPPLTRTVFYHNDKAPAKWISRDLPDGLTLRVASDGSMARVERSDEPVALIAPLVHCQGELPTLKRPEKTPNDGEAIRFQGNGVQLTLTVSTDGLRVSIRSERPCEGPVVRALGGLEQGLLSGLEYLGRGERSSSKLDIETEGHLRYAPDPMKVTLPLMALVTDRVSAAMTWTDMTLQPTFATPNFFDGTDDHRMALRGKEIDATVRFSGPHSTHSLDEIILTAVKATGLPPLPPAPRTAEQQRRLCLAGLNGPLRTEAGWGHCVQENWARQPFADMASTVWRLTGKTPDLPRLVPGGAHVPNDAIYFVTGRADQWLDRQASRAKATIARQQADGSFRYSGPYRRGHFEDTASGVCARPAVTLLEYARISGDAESLAAGVRALDFMKRFRTPRGAQVWECPLHTPDQLASAYAVWAYVRGYELTGKREYLDHARKWAATGIPFVYLWSCQPVMLYATPPVFGATHWKAPNWMGLPVQWVGGVYAYALTLLAPHDDTLDWNHLARGILISAEQQQYPDGPHVGLLPDSFGIRSQQRRPADINPCAILSLRSVLDGQLDSLCVAIDGQQRVVAPFPTTIRNGKAVVEARRGVDYQVILNGQEIRTIHSQGRDEVALP